MNTHIKKTILAIVAGIVFLVGGASTVNAAGPSFVDQAYSSALNILGLSNEPSNPLLASLECSLLPLRLSGCAGEFSYYFVYVPVSEFLIISARIFDFSLMLSINPQYVDQPFVTSAWEIVRDFSNMVFIFVLLYTGIMTMLGTAGARKTIVNVIIVALLINFSLFFTKVVIDAGNVLAVGVYESMGPPSAVTGQPRDISLAITKSFSPDKYISIIGGKVPTALEATTAIIVAIVVCAITGWIFLKLALVFVGRLLAFWFLMIISPFAFISMILPGGGKFGDWLRQLLNQAMMAPVFLFMLYLIMQFINAGGGIFTQLNSLSAGVSALFYGALIIPVLKATMIIMALFYALEFTKKLSGEFGKTGEKVFGKALGISAGVAFGGAGLVGRGLAGGVGLLGQKTVGRYAYNKLQDSGFKSWATKSSVGRLAFSATEKAAGATYDPRNTATFDYASSKVGAGLSKVGVKSYIGFGKGLKQGYAKDFEETKKADLAFAKKVLYDKDGKIIQESAEALVDQLKKGYITRAFTGGNVAAEAVAESILKDANKQNAKDSEKKKKQDQREERLTKLEQEQLDTLKDIKQKLKLPNDTRPLGDIPEYKKNKDEHLEKLEIAVAQAADNLNLTPKDDEKARAKAIIAQTVATRELKKFESSLTEIEKTQKSIDEIKKEKERDKEQEERDKKTDSRDRKNDEQKPEEKSNL